VNVKEFDFTKLFWEFVIGANARKPLADIPWNPDLFIRILIMAYE